jgi:hypothetical protein
MFEDRLYGVVLHFHNTKKSAKILRSWHANRGPFSARAWDRILCPGVLSTLSVDSGWPIREFSVYGSLEICGDLCLI